MPTLAALTTDVTDISAHVFAATEVETTKMKEDYKKVGKNFEEIFKGAKSVINLVETINKLTTAD